MQLQVLVPVQLTAVSCNRVLKDINWAWSLITKLIFHIFHSVYICPPQTSYLIFLRVWFQPDYPPPLFHLSLPSLPLSTLPFPCLHTYPLLCTLHFNTSFHFLIIAPSPYLPLHVPPPSLHPLRAPPSSIPPPRVLPSSLYFSLPLLHQDIQCMLDGV